MAVFDVIRNGSNEAYKWAVAFSDTAIGSAVNANGRFYMVQHSMSNDQIISI